MVKASWGTKRTCQNCAARFYDLNKSPIKVPEVRPRARSRGLREGPARRAARRRRRPRRAAAAAAAKLALQKSKKVEEAASDESADIESDDEALEDTDDLADEADDIEVESRGRQGRRRPLRQFASVASQRGGTYTSRPPESFGAIAQLGERYNGIVEVDGSIPSGSTNRSKGLAGDR